MVLWIFGYGSLIWKAGFEHDRRVIGYIRDYRRVFYQGSTDHRGTPEAPGRTVTLEYSPHAVTWGAAYCIEGGVDAEQTAISDESGAEPEIRGVLVFVGSPDVKKNPNYLGPASLESIARQIARSKGPSGTNAEYLFRLETSLQEIGAFDEHVTDLTTRVQALLEEEELDSISEHVRHIAMP